MARVNVYLPDDLADSAKAAGLNVSGITQEALRRALAAESTDDWLDEGDLLQPVEISHLDVIGAIEQARDDLDAGRG